MLARTPPGDGILARMRPNPIAVLTTLIVVLAARLLVSEASGPPLPARLGEYVSKHVRLTAAQHAQLAQGQPVTQALEADPSKEVSVFGLVWIKAPISRYLDQVEREF